MGRIVAFLLFILAFILLDWYRKKDTKKSVIAIFLFVYLIGLSYSGAILTRPIMPLFIAHIIFIAFAYFALFVYILKRKFLWYLFLLPLLSIALTFGINYLDGSRFEK